MGPQVPDSKTLGLHERYRGHALVTGAARGIGRAFAEELAREGFPMLLVDRDAEPTHALAAALCTEHGVETEVLIRDLAAPGLQEEAVEWARMHDVGFVVNNAGVSHLDPFLEISLDDHLEALDLNCRATLVLTHVFGRAMVERGRGGIAIVSSLSGLSGSPYFCHYAATKGYGLNLASGLWSELRGQGVDVVAVLPGMTDTKPVRDQGLDRALPVYVPMTAPGPVAREALRAIGGGPTVVPSFGDRVSGALVSKMFPRRWTLSMMKRSIEKMRR